MNNFLLLDLHLHNLTNLHGFFNIFPHLSLVHRWPVQLSLHTAARREATMCRFQLNDIVLAKALACKRTGHGGVRQVNRSLLNHHRASGLDQYHLLVGNRFPMKK